MFFVFPALQVRGDIQFAAPLASPRFLSPSPPAENTTARAGPTEARPADGLAVDFVVVSYRAQLSEIVRRVRDGRLRTNIGKLSTLDDAVAAFNPTKRIKAKRIMGKTIIRVRP